MLLARLLALVILMLAVRASAGEWPQFLGPDRTGVAQEKNLAASWPEDGPKVLWSFDLQQGFGGSAVVGSEVFFMDRTAEAGSEQDILYCLDLATGKEKWKVQYDAPGKVNFPGPRCTPSVDEDVVVAVGPMGHMKCIDRKTQKVLWTMNILKDFNTKMPSWGVAQSPVIYKDMVIFAPQSAEVGVMAVNKKTGKPAWQSQTIGRMSYSSAVIETFQGTTQVVMASGQSIVGIDIADGKILWKYEDWQSKHPIPTVTHIGKGKFFITSGYGAGCAMFQVTKDADWSSETLFKNGNCQTQMHNALLFEDHLYANSTAGQHGLVCLDLKGEVLWQSKALGKTFDIGGPLLIADGMIYIMDGGSGTLHLLKATPKGYEELAKAQVLKGKQVWAPMAISNGKLLCRDQKELKCLDVSGK